MRPSPIVHKLSTASAQPRDPPRSPCFKCTHLPSPVGSRKAVEKNKGTNFSSPHLSGHRIVHCPFTASNPCQRIPCCILSLRLQAICSLLDDARNQLLFWNPERQNKTTTQIAKLSIPSLYLMVIIQKKIKINLPYTYENSITRHRNAIPHLE